MTVKLGYSYWQPYTCTHPILCECIHVREEGLPVLRPHPLGCLHSNPRQAFLHKDGFMVRKEGTLTQRERGVKKRENFGFNRDAVFTVQFSVRWCQFQAKNNYRLGHASVCMVYCVQAWKHSSYDEINMVFYNLRMG